MGSEASTLRGFTLQDPPWTHPSGLTIHPALLQDGRLASVFVYKPESQEKVDKAAMHLKTLRHPCLLRFLSYTVEEDGIYLVTERVQPLEKLLPQLSSHEICAGIYDILQALVFLHDLGKVSHNNVYLSSVFVSEDEHWKLGGMEMVCKLTEAPTESAEFGILPVSLSHARDAFLFGRLIEDLLMHVNDHNDVLSSFKNAVKNSLLNPEPELRPTLSMLLSHDYFRNDFLEVVTFLECLTVKSEEEKNEFFKCLLDRVSALPEELISSRLVPLLLNPFVFAEPMAVKSFLPHLLRPKRDIMGRNREDCLLSPPLFQTKVIPVLMKMFEVHEEHVRVVLLTHIDAYGELFTLKELKDIILPQVLLGLRDTSDLLVAVTLRGLAALVCLLGPETVVGGGRVKIFKSTTPGFSKVMDTTLEENYFPCSLNNVSRHKDCLLTNCDQVQQSTEDWPDWSETEGNKSEISILQENTEIISTLGSEQWNDFNCDSSKTETTEASSNTNKTADDTKLSTLNSVSELDSRRNESHNVKSDKVYKPPLLTSGPGDEQAPKKKAEPGYGLGDEFTIKVRSKVKDLELDWFADMVPDIKLSSSSPLEYEEHKKTQTDVIPSVQQGTTFSSKFAAAEITEMEAEAEGWEEDNDFTWEENGNNCDNLQGHLVLL
ncbi:protein-associating with the carboxyl-terminal domain of ezrin [Hyperolius riggenbachi]|uniref:protein-associating with the carboxyl-terminal domain of ezrin n=1 Tax=Hyperolius riggenbachi TaxID=752182 RepID=UPI0035A27F5D